jgi:acyl-coenzyme A synthetase/AMP-(fatty) acid ligase
VDKTFTYGEAAEWIDTVAAQLSARGISSENVVAVMLSNRIEFPIVVMAAWRLGAIFTPVNPTFTTDEAGPQIADAAARLVVHDRVRADLSGFDTLDVDDLAPPRPDHAPGGAVRGSGRPRRRCCAADLHVRVDRSAVGCDAPTSANPT